MDHRCHIDGSSAVCIEVNNELWVKEYADGFKSEGRTYRVKFCPECGFKLPEKCFGKGFGHLSRIPSSETDNRISEFSYELGKAISEMNHNISLIKTFMTSQNAQNECFMQNEMELRTKITELEKAFIRANIPRPRNETE